jgi:hypothetical protein
MADWMRGMSLVIVFAVMVFAIVVACAAAVVFIFVV